MKSIILILSLIAIIAISGIESKAQTVSSIPVQIREVKSGNVAFGKTLLPGTWIYVSDSSKFYVLTETAVKNDKLSDVAYVEKSIQGPTGATGATGAAGAVGPTGAEGPTGAVGPTGAEGPTGATGATGAAGSVWHSGSGAPGAELGVNGDFYINTANGDVYKKTDGSWGSPIIDLIP